MLELNKMTFCLTHVLLLLSDYIYDRDTPIEDDTFGLRPKCFNTKTALQDADSLWY